MGKASVPTRVNADVANAAGSVASAENRSTTEQINYWARLGMQVERASSLDGRRILGVVSGAEQFSTLSDQDRVVAHATIDAQMAERVASENFGEAARRAGQVSVFLDDDGSIVEVGADGVRRPL